MALVKFDKLLLIACAFFVSAPATSFASTDSPPPATTSFAYSISHAVTPLPGSAIDRLSDQDSAALEAGDDSEGAEWTHEPTVEVRVGPSHALSQSGLCSAVVSVARANNLPIPFFANLIWQESNFNTKVISRAGAQGIAQFMPKTAVEFGLINPFEPIHALNVAGRFVRELHEQFGNLGLAAMAYNAGPRRVINWVAKRGELPGETRNYVLKITGRPAEAWTSPQAKSDPEIALMPAKAPCVEVAEAVKLQTRLVRISKLMVELAQATTPLPRDKPDSLKPAAAESKVADAGPDRKGRGAHMAKASRKGSDDTEASAAKRLARTAEKSSGKNGSRKDSKTASKAESKFASRTVSKAESKAESKSASKTTAKDNTKLAAKDTPKESAKETTKESTKENEVSKENAGKAATPRHRSARRTRVAYSVDHRPY
jgi:hypothetical protein